MPLIVLRLAKMCDQPIILYNRDNILVSSATVAFALRLGCSHAYHAWTDSNVKRLRIT